jgi:hypothetical protein
MCGVRDMVQPLFCLMMLVDLHRHSPAAAPPAHPLRLPLWPLPRPQEDEFWSQDRERVYLVGVSYKNWSSPQEQAAAAAVARARATGGAQAAAARRAQQFDVHSSLEELGRLADTAGLKVGLGEGWRVCG